jgi:hypothetical protein
MHTNGAHKNNDNTTPIFIGLNNTAQKARTAQEKFKIDVLKQMYFNVNNENAVTLEYVNLMQYGSLIVILIF